MCCDRNSVAPRRQSISQPESKSKPILQHRIAVRRETTQTETKKVSAPLKIERKIVAVRCQICGFLIQAVNSSGKVIMKCSNTNCGG